MASGRAETVSAAGPDAAGEVNTNGVVFWPVAVLVFVADRLTKAFAEAALGPPGWPQRVVGDALRFTLVYNPGAAFGLHVGPYSRVIFLVLTAVVLRALWMLYQRTADRDNARTAALALVCAGALGNAVDRLRSARGVVDFLDVGVGAHRWPTFNLADVAVTTGALLLVAVLWREDRAGDGAAPGDVVPRPAHAPSAAEVA